MKIYRLLALQLAGLLVMAAAAACSGQNATPAPATSGGAAAQATPAASGAGGAATATPASVAAQPATAEAPAMTAAPLATEAPVTPEASATSAAPLSTAAPAQPAATLAGASTSGGDSRDVLIKASQALLDAPAFRSTITSTDVNSNTTTTVTLEYVAPDRYHFQAGGVETVIISPTVYMRQPGGSWQQTQAGVGDILRTMRQSMSLAEEADGITNAQYVGPDTVDGKPAQVYQYTYNLDNLTSTARMWISTADNRPLRAESDNTIQGVKYKSTVVYSYDSNIKIEPPTQ